DYFDLERIEALKPAIDACGIFFFSSRRRHTRSDRDWSSDVCSSDLTPVLTQTSSASRPPRFISLSWESTGRPSGGIGRTSRRNEIGRASVGKEYSYAEYLDFESIEALKPAIEAGGISTLSQSPVLGF